MKVAIIALCLTFFFYIIAGIREDYPSYFDTLMLYFILYVYLEVGKK